MMHPVAARNQWLPVPTGSNRRLLGPLPVAFRTTQLAIIQKCNRTGELEIKPKMTEVEVIVLDEAFFDSVEAAP